MISYTKEFSFWNKRKPSSLDRVEQDYKGIVGILFGLDCSEYPNNFEAYVCGWVDGFPKTRQKMTESDMKDMLIEDTNHLHEYAVRRVIKYKLCKSESEVNQLIDLYKQEADELNRKNKLGKYRTKK